LRPSARTLPLCLSTAQSGMKLESDPPSFTALPKACHWPALRQSELEPQSLTAPIRSQASTDADLQSGPRCHCRGLKSADSEDLYFVANGGAATSSQKPWPRRQERDPVAKGAAAGAAKRAVRPLMRASRLTRHDIVRHSVRFRNSHHSISILANFGIEGH